MSATSAILRNRHAVWALALGAAIFGALAYVTLPMQLFPDTAPPVVNVLTRYPGAGAEDVAQNLSDPLEEELAALGGIDNVRTTSRDGLSMISLEFQYDRNVDLAAVDVQNAIARIRTRLPTGIQEPQVLTFSTNDRPVVSLGVVAADPREARRFADEVVAPHLRRISGVAAVDVFGGAVDAVLVDVDPRRLAAYRLPLTQLVEAIRAHNATLPAGSLQTPTSRIPFRLEARATEVGELAAIPIHPPTGGRLLLGEVAEIRRDTLDDDATFAIDGQRAIAVQVFKTTEANTIEVVHQVLAAAEELEAAHPSFRLLVGEESASFAEVSIGNLLDNVWQALAMAGLIIFLFVGRLRPSLVLVVSMPLSFGMTFGLMRLTDVQLDMVTLSAIILSVGMVVDASVVVLENIIRHRERHDGDPMTTAATGADEVRLPVLAGAATTVIVLVPLLFLSGFVGKTFGPLAQTMLFAFVSSVVVALVLVPVLSLYAARRGRLDRLGERATAPFRALIDRVRDGYVWLLRHALRHRLLTIGLALVMFAAGAAGIRARGMDVLPPMDGGSFFVAVETPSGSSLAATERVVRDIEAVLLDEPEVVKVQAQVGFEPGMRSMSSGVLGPTQAFITVVLTDRTARDETIWSIEERVRDRLALIPGIHTVTVRELGNTAKSTTSAPIVARISGPDALVLDRLGDEVLARVAAVSSVVQPVRSWRLDQRRYRVDVDRLRSHQLGLSPAAISAHMQAGSVGTSAGDYQEDGTTVPLQVRYHRDPNGDARSLLEYPIITPTSEPIPLRTVAAIEETRGPALLSREAFVPTLEITAFTRGRALSFVIDEVQAALDELVVPEGYEVGLTGENADLADARRQIGGALATALVAVYLLLVAQLRSFLHPFTILMSVPLSLSGVGIALGLAGKAVSMPVMIAFVLLVGIVVNNAIILVDFVRQARATGVSRHDALVGSVTTRFRPIMVTSISTIVGMIPLAAEWALGAERFSPLALAVIGGMAAASFLTMVFVPVLYDLLDDLAQRRPRRRTSLVTLLLLLLAAALVARPGTARAESSLSLDVATARRMATAHNPGLRAERHQVGAARARAQQARGTLLPRLDLTSRYSRVQEVEPRTLELPSAPTGGIQFGDAISDLWYARAAITQPLFDLERHRRYGAAERGVALAEGAAAVTAATLGLEVEVAYFALLRLRALDEAARESVLVLEAHAHRLQVLEEAGRALPVDVARAETRAAQARLELARLEGRAAVASARLATMVGVPTTTPLVLTEPLEPGIRPEDRAPHFERAYHARPELGLAEAQLAVAAHQRAAAEGARWPKLSLQAGYTFANPNDRYVPPQSEFHGTWDVSVVLQWSLDWGVTSGRIAEAEHQERAADAMLAGAREQAQLEIEQAHAALVAAARAVEVATQAVALAEASVAQVRTLFEAGRISSTELLERESDLTRARTDYVDALIDHRLADAALRRAIGE